MTLEELQAFLCLEAKRINGVNPGVVWYLFGSVLRSFDSATDIDLLVVCPTGDASALVRRELREACMRLPLHLLLMTREEETELDFIDGQQCVQIYPATAQPGAAERRLAELDPR
jgi:hypothetical protein